MKLPSPPGLLPSGLNRRRRTSIARIDELGYELIRRRRAGSDGADLLNLLVSTELSDVEIRNELMTMFFAGHETSASALAWAFYELSEQPEIADTVVSELESVLGEPDPTLADLPRLPYLGSVVKETLRHWPPGWLFDRTPIEPTTIGGVPLPPRTDPLLQPVCDPSGSVLLGQPARVPAVPLRSRDRDSARGLPAVR